MATLRQKQAAAKKAAATNKVRQPKVEVAVNADPSEAILQVAQLMQQQFTGVMAALETMQKQQTALTDAITALKIEGGDIEVNIPRRATGFRIEYDEVTDQPMRLIPEYEDMH